MSELTSITAKLKELRSLLGSGYVGEREGKPAVSPMLTQEVAALARYAHSHRLAMEIVGSGTKRRWGSSVAADIFLDTTKLAGVSQHSWQDLTATVGAGTRWSDMQLALATHNQRVALDPLWAETATVGGIVATNDSGSLRLKYGSLRDLIIGMTIVLADGTIAKSGGKVVKNVAGYDLHKLMTGALGTLGIITEVTFRLHPIPNQTRTWSISSSNVDLTSELMLKVLDSHLSTQAMQLRASAAGFALDVELASLPGVLSDQLEVLDGFARSSGMTEVDSSRTGLKDVFKARQELFSLAGGVLIKATMLPTAIGDLSSDVVRWGGSAVTQATGIMFARFTEGPATHALPSLYADVDAAGDGSLSILRAPSGPVPDWMLPPWGPERAPDLMQEIKHRFDPKRILNPGRSLGGL